MTGLTNEQLQARCRVLAPITVVRDEDYTVLTPTQIAAAWSAYSGGTDGVYLQNVAGTWAEMDPDLPKANDRGLLVFGGGKQYAQRCDFADCTVGQPIPASWTKALNGLTSATVIAKDEQYGLPYVDVEFVGTPTLNWSFANQAGVHALLAAEFVNGDLLVCRSMIDVLSLPASVSQIKAQLNDELDTKYTNVVMSLTTGLKETEATFSVDLGENTHRCYTPVATHTASVELSPSLQYRYFPFLYSINTAFPSHFHCINTSTSSAATIVPEVMQRPAALDKAWSMAIVAGTGKRDLGAHQVIWCSSTDADNYVLVYRATSTGQITLHVRAAGVDYTKALGVIALSTTFRLSIRATAQVFTASLNGGAVQTLAAPRPATLTAESLGHHYDGTLCGWSTIESLTTRTGLATDAQLEEWSTLS